MSRFDSYYKLTKPGIIRGNLFHALAGVLLATPSLGSIKAAICVLVGTGLVIASACVVNNILDRPFDAKMKRTKTRPSVTGEVKTGAALIYATILAVLGFLILVLGTNLLTVMIGAIAYVSYSFIYTYSKRVTVHSTIIGTIPGALPAMAGYTGVSGQLDMAAWLIFVLIGVWQLPHFYAIAAFRRKEYAATGWPILSTRISEEAMRRVIISTLVLYWLVAVVFSAVLLKIPSAILVIGGASYWLYMAISRQGDYIKWARKVFYTSMLLSVVLVAAVLLDFTLKVFLK